MVIPGGPGIRFHSFTGVRYPMKLDAAVLCAETIVAAPHLSKLSNFPQRSRRSPEQQERNTNITVHREKRSVQPAQIVRFYKRVLISEQRRNHTDPGPRRPRQQK